MLDPKIHTIIQELLESQPTGTMGPLTRLDYVSIQVAHLHVLLAQEGEKQSERLEKQMVALVGIAEAQMALAIRLDRQTSRLISLTRALAFLTLLLLLFTAYLSYDAYLNSKGGETAKPHAGQKAQFYRVHNA